MKSFALHLVVVLMITTYATSSETTATASTAAAAATTTARPPSLPSPPSVALASLATSPTPLLAHTDGKSFNASANSRSGRSYDGSQAANNGTTAVYQLQQKRLHRFHVRPEVHQSQTQQTTKTPRMIHRLVAGHLQHPSNRIDRQELTTKPTTTTTTTNAWKKTYQLSSSYRSKKPATAATTEESSDDRDDDEAFLESPQEDILPLSAGAGKEPYLKTKKGEKTLADQVRDGKYGLIEKELFREAPRRPGVLSYLPNKEVPSDNERNFGGLDEEDIWLAEDHLLVIKGGGLNDQDNNEPWPPLDDYEAPDRQIKIPPNPKVPPPFPVQFEENGPVQVIGDNKFPFIYTLANESLPVYPAGEAGYYPAAPAGDNEKNLLARPGAAEDAANRKPGYLYPAAYPPWLVNNETFAQKPLNGRPVPLPAIGPFPFGFNGSLDAFNGTDYFDEDDPSLYYPPPYSFVYKSNYSNPVPPGPLVPGIVLPPPPNAFARLERVKNRPSTTTEIPFRNILTKITEYEPKTIIVTPIPHTTRTPTPVPIPTTTSAPPQTVQIQKQIVYAITTTSPPPTPTQKTRYYSTAKPPSISFVPKTHEKVSLKSNPIYYEYYDARKEEPTTVLTTTPPSPPPPPKPTKAYRIKPATVAPARDNYPPPKQYAFDDYVYITPKPDPRPNSVSDNYAPYLVKPSFKAKPIQSFEQEVDAIRQTLQFFKNKQLDENQIPRAHKKPKPIYEFTYDATKNRQFNPQPQFDQEPFKPMVTYSPAAGDADSFKAIAYSKADSIPSNYYSTSTPQPSYQPRQKKTRAGAKYLNPIVFDPQATVRPAPQNYRTILTTQQPWHQVPAPTQRPQKLRVPPGFSRNFENGQFTGYNYNPSVRQNHRYYDEPFSQPRYRPIVNTNQYQQPVPPQQTWNLENDTYINYGPNRPPVDPNSELINPYPPAPPRPQSQRLQAAPVYSPNRPQYQQQQQALPPPPPPSLYRDTLVNYRHPLPPINPDSEFIAHPQVINSHHRNNQLPPGYRQVPVPQVQYRPPPPQPPEQSNIYYIAPQYKRNNN